MFRQASLDSQTPNRDMRRVEELLKELREGDFGRGLRDEVKSTALLIKQKQANNEKMKQRHDLLERKIKLVSDLTSLVWDASGTSGEWKGLEQLEQKEFESILELVIGKEGSLDRIRNMSPDAMGRLKNLEAEIVEQRLSEKIADLEAKISRIRTERNDARTSRTDALAERNEALTERDSMQAKRDAVRKRADDAEIEIATLSKELEDHKALLKTKISRLDALEKEAELIREENLKSGSENTELGDSLTAAYASLKEAEEKLKVKGASLDDTMAKLKEVTERKAHVDGLVVEKDERVAQLRDTLRARDTELLRLFKEKLDAWLASKEAKEAAVASRREHDQRIKQLQDEAKKALDDQAALHSEQMQEMQVVVNNALREKQALDSNNADMRHDLCDRDITIISLRKKAIEDREAKETAQKEVDACTAELDHQRQQGESTIAERDQQIEEALRQKEERELELERVSLELEKVKEELTTKSLALTEIKDQQQSDSTANKAIQERLAKIFMAQSGCQQSDIGRWLTFVKVAGQADLVSCGDQLTAQGRTWTILQQWDSQTVTSLSAAVDTVEELLVRLYGKVGETEMDDETIDLVRRLVVSAETIGQVPFSLVRFVIGECLGLVEKSSDYHAVAVAFGLYQLVSLISRRCSQDVGELQQRLESMLSDQSTSLGTLLLLLGSDNGLGLKGRIRKGQELSLPEGVVVPARYCLEQDVAVLVLPESSGFVWVLELATNGIRRVKAGRLAVVENYEWRLTAIEGDQDIILPSEDWEWYCEMIGGA
ncbi:hypothetical protein FHL15_004884 [Xylaria flabelliformis]|uniref:Uncharacterized protein n=1 Tax=Xylaria flabelliformis TaxID=2512241 RepID=A0A553I1N4_9PEZI|nr:hypothetical protein FHL15_004884 [Xylaria flabelliformis]